MRWTGGHGTGMTNGISTVLVEDEYIPFYLFVLVPLSSSMSRNYPYPISPD